MVNYFSEQEADSLETSEEILRAISELTSCREEALQVWKDGCFECKNPEAEQAEILNLAWSYVDDGDDILCWGEDSFRYPETRKPQRSGM